MRTRAVTVTVGVVALLGPAGCGGVAPVAEPSPSAGATSLVTVPRIAEGASYDVAVRRLDSRGLEVAEVDFRGPFYVVGTRPTAGTRVPAGSTVELVVGDG